MAAVHYHCDAFPPEERIEWSKLIPLIGPAAAAVARYDGMLAAIPSPDVLFSPLTTQEAVLSSRIEGTQATIGEVLVFEAGQEPQSSERQDDIHEIINYRVAMRHAEVMMKSLPLCQRVIKDAHALLLAGVRGRGKLPGEYRRTSNWIGAPGCTVEDARFVPISPAMLPDAIGKWERYIHGSTPDRLVQLAVLHAEFEALHPFLDGNGRVGRMLIPLFLWKCQLIRQPVFYISEYLESHREAYYESLLAVSREENWTGWCIFFLEALKVQAEENLIKTRGILDLYDDMKSRMTELTRSQYVIEALDWVFKQPIFSVSDFAGGTGIPKQTARRLFRKLCDGGIVTEISPKRGRRASILAFEELLNVLGAEVVA